MGNRPHILSGEEMHQLLGEAARQCAQKVPIRVHKTPSGRRRLGRPRDKYVECIKAFIEKKILEAAKAKGYAVDPSWEAEVNSLASKYGF